VAFNEYPPRFQVSQAGRAFLLAPATRRGQRLRNLDGEAQASVAPHLGQTRPEWCRNDSGQLFGVNSYLGFGSFSCTGRYTVARWAPVPAEISFG
jgi:hypothetical protein